jgi:hypothetical protein
MRLLALALLALCINGAGLAIDYFLGAGRRRDKAWVWATATFSSSVVVSGALFFEAPLGGPLLALLVALTGSVGSVWTILASGDGQGDRAKSEHLDSPPAGCIPPSLAGIVQIEGDRRIEFVGPRTYTWRYFPIGAFVGLVFLGIAIGGAGQSPDLTFRTAFFASMTAMGALIAIPLLAMPLVFGIGSRISYSATPDGLIRDWRVGPWHRVTTMLPLKTDGVGVWFNESRVLWHPIIEVAPAAGTSGRKGYYVVPGGRFAEVEAVWIAATINDLWADAQGLDAVARAASLRIPPEASSVSSAGRWGGGATQ